MTQEKILTQETDDNEFWMELEINEAKRKSRGSFKYPDIPQYKEMENLLNNIDIIKPIKNGIVLGTYCGSTPEQHTFSVSGFKDNVYIDNKIGETKYLKNTQIGDKIDILILNVNEKIYSIEGSIASIYESKARETLKDLDEDLVVIAQIKSVNPAGYDVDILHDGVTLPGFMPNTLAGINKLYDINSIVNTEMEVMIESFSQQEGTYIVSRRKYLKTLIPEALDGLRTNTVYSGKVTGTTPFGVFVEFLECLTGMIHKANIQENWQNRISEIKPGMEIEFYVKEIIKDKIILTQVIRESLWDTIKIGQSIEGKVKDNKPFGTLISLDPETMGLIHFSEGEKLGYKFVPGEDITVRVLALDRNARKIFLAPSN